MQQMASTGSADEKETDTNAIALASVFAAARKASLSSPDVKSNASSPRLARTPDSQAGHVRRRSSNSSTMSGIVENLALSVTHAVESPDNSFRTRAFRSSQRMKRERSPDAGICSSGESSHIDTTYADEESQRREHQAEDGHVKNGGTTTSSQNNNNNSLGQGGTAASGDGGTSASSSQSSSAGSSRSNSTTPTPDQPLEQRIHQKFQEKPDAPPLHYCDFKSCFRSFAALGNRIQTKILGGRRNACWDLLQGKSTSTSRRTCPEHQRFIDGGVLEC